MQPPKDFLPPWHAPPSAKDTSAPPVEPDDATISAMRARMQNVRREIAGLRSKYPELDWTFVGEDLTPRDVELAWRTCLQEEPLAVAENTSLQRSIPSSAN